MARRGAQATDAPPAPGSIPAGGRTLLLAGDTLHVRDAAGRYCTHRALARQLDQWFAEFDHVVIAATIDPGPVPTGFAPYADAAITFVPLRQAGGTGLRAKLGSLRASFSWARALVPLLRRSEVVHLRAPCNVTVVAIPLARLLARRRYAIYAGAWDPPPGGSASYRVQRWLLRRWGGVVHVYAPPSDDLGANLRPNFSPTFDAARIAELGGRAAARLERLRSAPPAEQPLRLCCVGRFSANKNQVAVVQAAARLIGDGTPVTVRFAGAGGAEPEVRALVEALGIGEHVTFLGRCDEAELVELYAWADVNVAPSFVEGFGRVIVEGMALGCPAVTGPGVMQAAMVGGGRLGAQVDPADPADLAAVLARLRAQPADGWAAMAASCRAYAGRITIEAFGADVRSLLGSLRGPAAPDAGTPSGPATG